MVRLVQITLPAVNDADFGAAGRAATGQQQFDLLMDLLMEMDHVHCLASFSGNNCHLLSFKSPDKHVTTIVGKLEKLGVGINFGTVDVTELLSTQPRITTYGEAEGHKRRKYQFNERLSMTEVYETIDQQSHLTFNYLALTLTAACLAAVGLAANSTTTVVASMLVSPLMGPILSLTLGVFVRDKRMAKRGLRNEAWGILISLVTGILVGFVVAPFHGPGGVTASWATTTLRSYEMESRGDAWGLLTGFAVAVPSGVGVSLAVTGGGINALVGVAISAALLPPIVNSGLGLSLGVYYAAGENSGEGSHFLALSLISFVLFFINLVIILLVGLLMFRVKNVEPLKDRSADWHTGMSFNQSLLSSSFRRPEAMAALAEAKGPGEESRPLLVPSGGAMTVGGDGEHLRRPSASIHGAVALQRLATGGEEMDDIERGAFESDVRRYSDV